MTIRNTIEVHIDAKHFNFMLIAPLYITVNYVASNESGKVCSSISAIAAEPCLINSLVINGTWWTVDKELMAAAQCHAEKEFSRNRHVDETILSALVGHI